MKKVLILISVFLTIILGTVIYYVHKDNNSELYSSKNENKKTNINSFLTLMLETEANSGIYEESNSSLWPGEEYIFNSELSTCQNGGDLSWNSETNTINLLTNSSDSCYVYFDVYVEPTFADYCRENNSSSLACHVATQYTIDGANGLYYHTSSLANSARDNSYRYAGGDYQIIESYKDQYNSIYGEIIKYYCDDIEDNDNCNYDTSQFYYTLTYDNANTKYTHAQALSKAISDGYITNNIINNYVCFGSTASLCPNDNLYRIIGVFDGEAKLIKADYSTYNQLGTNGTYSRLYVDSSAPYFNTTHYKGHNTNSIGAYYWDNVENKSEWSWNNTNLNILNLNQNYLNSLDNEWSSMITTHTWKTGGINKFSSIGTPQTTYNYEVGANSSSTTYNAKIGLMYVSDYGFAASNTYWSTDLNSYNSAPSNNNWLYLGLNEWTITNDNDFGFFIAYFGAVSSNVVYWNNVAIRPVFYLNPDVQYVSGTGTESDPFRIA